MKKDHSVLFVKTPHFKYVHVIHDVMYSRLSFYGWLYKLNVTKGIS